MVEEVNPKPIPQQQPAQHVPAPVDEQSIKDIQEMEEEFAMEDSAERQQDVQEQMYDAPSYGPKDDLYSLFWKVVNLKNSSKVGNLDKAELGLLNLSVRDCQRIALLAFTLNRPGFGMFFQSMGEITLATSASKKGWFSELFVSQKKLSTRTREVVHQQEQSEAEQPPPPRPQKKGFFRRR